MNTFKKGDKVKCIDAITGLENGKEYIIKCNILDTLVYVEGIALGYYPSRFELVKPKVDKHTFKVGDKVRCIDVKYSISGFKGTMSYLELDKEYRVREIEQFTGYVYLEGILGGYYYTRFKLIKPKEEVNHE